MSGSCWAIARWPKARSGRRWSFAGHYQLNNLIGILDMNRLGQRGETMLRLERRRLRRPRQSLRLARHRDRRPRPGSQINDAYARRQRQTNEPTLIIAKTIKGKGFCGDREQERLARQGAARGYGGAGHCRTWRRAQHHRQAYRPAREEPAPHPEVPSRCSCPPIQVGTAVATRSAYGDALKALGAARPDVVALDGEVSNSTYAETFAKAFPDRFFEQYIAEQQTDRRGDWPPGARLSCRSPRPSRRSSAAPMTSSAWRRSRAPTSASVGSHAGVSIGEDGPSQMALEDLAMMRAVYGSTVLYPSDANQTAQLVGTMADLKGIVFLRTTREKTPILYGPTSSSHWRQPCGAPVGPRPGDGGWRGHHAARGAQGGGPLKSEGVDIRVIDLYSVKPVDVKTLREAARATGGRSSSVEDHWREGGLGDAVLEALAGSGLSNLRVTQLAVTKMPGSGKPEELMAAAGIDAAHIVEAVQAFKGAPVV